MSDRFDFTYEELQGIVRRIQKRAMPKLWEYRKELKDPYSPFKTKILIYVPHPTLFAPYPCFLVAIANPKSKMFFRVGSLEEVEEAFKLPDDARQDALVALQNAKNEAERLQAIHKALEVSKDLAKRLSAFDEHDIQEIEAYLRQQRESSAS